MQIDGLPFVALISGGKDSCMCMMEAVKRGHRLIAMANLLPVNRNDQDIDSWMFQTAGHGMIDALAACVPTVPMYRKSIRGTAVVSQLSYETATPADEVEDLYELLRQIKVRHPELKAVCSGAILSNYQRLRVERVCERLQLVSLAYLWERDQKTLLSSMIDAGIDAVLVKVAAMGLVPKKHLGLTLKQMQPTLLQLEKQFGCSVCGEGGEYESFVLDCPLFTRKIVLSKKRTNVVVLSSDPIAPVGLLVSSSPKVFDKATGARIEDSQIGANVVMLDEDDDAASLPAPPNALIPPDVSDEDLRKVVVLSETITDVLCHARFRINVSDFSSVDAAFAALASKLLRGRVAESVFVNIVMHDISLFQLLNGFYGRFVGHKLPPSRAVWQANGLRERCCFVTGECLFLGQRSLDCKKLHVQSISCWAPACIGPYSQVASVGGLLFVSGQIPLDPPTMRIEQQSLELCFDHAFSVIQSQGIKPDAVRKSIVMTTILVANDAPFPPPQEISGLKIVMRVQSLPRGASYEVVCVASTVVVTENEREVCVPKNDDVFVERISPNDSCIGFAVATVYSKQGLETDFWSRILRQNERPLYRRVYVLSSTDNNDQDVIMVNGFEDGVYAVMEFAFISSSR